MKSFLYKISNQAALTTVMLLLVFAPFRTLIAQAQVSCPPGQPSDGTCIPSGATSAAPAAQTIPKGIFANCGITSTDGLTACVSALIYAFTIGIGSVFA